MKVQKIGDHLMARIEEKSRIFEVNFDRLEIQDVTLSFHKDGKGVGSIYNDDGTERLMARLSTVGEEDFISTEVEKEFVEKILEKAEEEQMIIEADSTLKAYKTRIGLDFD